MMTIWTMRAHSNSNSNSNLGVCDLVGLLVFYNQRATRANVAVRTPANACALTLSPAPCPGQNTTLGLIKKNSEV
jgi:hypothetical protein